MLKYFIISFILCFLYTCPALATEDAISHKKWRVIYVEGGQYYEFSEVFLETVNELVKRKIITSPIPQNLFINPNSRKIWQWLTNHAQSSHLEFLKDGFYSFEWDESIHKKQEAILRERLENTKDVDLILAFGTAAGIHMATDKHNIPTLSLAATDAVGANIVPSKEDSGKDHVYAQVASESNDYNLSVFHDIFNFKKLGVPVPKSNEGRALIGFSDLQESIENAEFDIVPCELAVINNENLQEDFKMCIETLAKSSDAIYFPVIPGSENWAKMDALLAPIIRAGIPSFSQHGNQETKLGVLMSLAPSSFQPQGQAAAAAIEKILAGVSPRSINQVVENLMRLELNLKMALLIGWHPPFEVLVSVDKVYQKFFTMDELGIIDTPK